MNAKSERGKNLANFAYLAFLAAWSLGIIFLIGKQFMLNKLLFMSDGTSVFINDFLHFYCAGQMVVANPAAIYDPGRQMLFMEKLIAPLHAAQVFYIQYVPFVFLFSVPLAFLPVKAAYLIWTAFSCACILVCLLLMHKFVRRYSSWQGSAIIFLGYFASLSNYECLELGQLSNCLLLLLVVYFIGLIKPAGTGSYWQIAAGTCLALSSFKPHYAILLAIPAIAKRRWTLLLSAFAVETCLLVISGQILGWQNVWSYPKIVLEADTNPAYGGVHAEHMVSIRGFLSQFMPDQLSLKVSLFFLLLAAIFLSYRWMKTEKSSAAFRHCFSLTVFAIVVFSPHTNLYDCALLAIAGYLILPSCNIFDWGDSSHLPQKRLLYCIVGFYPLVSALIFVLWEYLPIVSQNPLPFFLMHLLVFILLAFGRTQEADEQAA